MAEDSGLIVDLGALVMAEACRQTSEWNLARPGQPPLSVAVNLSARQLESAGLPEFVEATLANSTGLDPGLLHLEITESVLMDDVEASRASLQALKALGITLVVDDFGTGYSSLVYLRRFPVDALKVDCSFVAGLGRNADDSTIVAAVVGLARALGLATVAEGVETADQAARLLELGCDQAQGYLWSPAVPADELADLLDRTPISLSPARARVLIVDDEPVVRDLLRLALELEGGFTVVAEASDGRQGIDLAREHQPDLVLLDLLMPGMGGLEAVGQMARVAPNAKVVVLTAIDRSSVAPDTIANLAGFYEKTSDLSAVTQELAILVRAAS